MGGISAAAPVHAATVDGKPKPKPEPVPWSPAPGVVFNNPLLPRRRHVINRKVRKAIEKTHKGQTIRLITWNLKSELYTQAIVNAHRRGVGVRVIMSAGLAAGQTRNGSYATIKRALSQGNKSRPRALRSWVRVCHNSCRGPNGVGIVHSKFFLFSKVGPARDIVMSASGNLTEVAANRQWDDLTTVVNQPKTYDNFVSIFDQASHDKVVKPAFHKFRDGDLRGWFFPRMGQSDIVLNLLRPVRCQGAVRAGALHPTIIRIAQAVFNGKRGLAIAKRIRALHVQGCNIRIDYTAMANSSQAVLDSVPKRHIVQDFNGDGIYDRYLHMKAVAINGHYGKDRSYKVVLNGSANWSGMSLKSDEQGLILYKPKIVDEYIAWINHIFDHPPPRPVVTNPPPTTAKGAPVVNPYANVEFD
jgi:phosphatidylserine/phosphatidylglycerophosphate/cardiolipin synthase-like enzyme